MTEPTKPTGIVLKPCPFCGGEAAHGHSTYTKNHQCWWADGSRVLKAYHVQCVKCGANRRGIAGGSQTPDKAVEHWNARHGLSEIAATQTGEGE